MELYAVTISGHKHYFTGKLSELDIKMIDEFCNTLNEREITTNHNSVFSCLNNFIRNDLRCKIEFINIRHIFRINR